MFEDKINKINKLPGLKKQIQRKAIILFLEQKHDFPMSRLMMKEKFGQISKGGLKLQINGKVVIEDVNTELIEVVHELIEEEFVKINN